MQEAPTCGAPAAKQSMEDIMAQRFKAYMMRQGKQFITGLVSDIVSGLSDKVDEVAESQARTDTRIEHLASSVSEVKESLAAANGLAQAQERRFMDRINELQTMIEGLSVGSAQSQGAASSNNGPRRDAAGDKRAGDHRDTNEHVVLLQFAEPMVIETLRGLEASNRSHLCPDIIPTACESKRFHDFLAVKHKSFDAAARYAAKLNEKCFDPGGRTVAIIHKGDKE